jgi:hypothetical protein
MPGTKVVIDSANVVVGSKWQTNGREVSLSIELVASAWTGIVGYWQKLRPELTDHGTHANVSRV